MILDNNGSSEDLEKVHFQIEKDGFFSDGFGNDTDLIYAPDKENEKALNKF